MTATAATHTSLRFAVLLIFANGFLDAHTFLARGGVFANVQTGNVIFGAIDLAQRRWSDALAHAAPIVAFALGIVVGAAVRSGRVDRWLRRPLWAVMGIQAVALAAFGAVPASVPHTAVTVPISFLAAVQIGLFRTIGDLNYMPVATTGNLMRLVEAGYSGVADHDAAARSAFRTYLALFAAFSGGALVGAVATHALGTRAILVVAGCLAATLGLFVFDERAGRRRSR